MKFRIRDKVCFRGRYGQYGEGIVVRVAGGRITVMAEAGTFHRLRPERVALLRRAYEETHGD